MIACTIGEVSPVGSNSSTFCEPVHTTTTPGPSITTTVPPGTTTEPQGTTTEPQGTSTEPPSTTPAGTTATVTFVATLQMTAAEFNSTQQILYKTGVAATLGVSIHAVVIGSVTEIVARRRLLATTIEVETIVTVPAEDAEAVSQAATSENLNTALEGGGIVVEEMSAPVVEGGSVSTPVESTAVESTPVPSNSVPVIHEWTQVGC
jgi:hypothetical protein